MELVADKKAFADRVKGIMTFKFLSDAELLSLLEVSDIACYEEGEPICVEGEGDPYFFGIISGTVGVHVKETDREVYICTLGAGDVFGESGIFMNVKRTASVSALSSAYLFRVHRNAFSRFLKTKADAGNKMLLVIIYSLIRKLRVANQELAYERKSDMGQDEIDAMAEALFGEKN